MLGKSLIMAFGLLGYLAGSLSLVVLFLFLGKWFPQFSIDEGTLRPASQAVVINLGLMMLWSIQHIGMAQRPFKRWILRWLPAPIERANYVLATALAIFVLVGLWSPMPELVWQVTDPLGRSLVSALFVFGWLYALAGIFYDNYFEFHGLEQAWRHFRGQSFSPSGFKTGFLFQLSRRPTFFGLLIASWATPELSQGHLLYALTMTLFIIVGSRSVERTYVENYGAAYQRVQTEKPLIIPDPRLLWPARGRYAGGERGSRQDD